MALKHPMMNGMGSRPYGRAGFSNQLSGGFLSDLWEDFREDTLDPLVDKTLTNVGLSPEQAEQLKAQAGDAYKKELQKKQQELIQSVTGTKTVAPSPSTDITTTIKETFTDIQKSDVVKAIPGGIYTIAGVLGGLTLYLILRK